MFKEGNRDCIENLLKPSRSILDRGISIRNEPYEKRQALFKEIATAATRYRNGECGRFLTDLNARFLALFDASLLLLALSFRRNGEQYEEQGYFTDREIDTYETIEKFGYFRIFSKKDLAKKIQNRDEKTLALLKEYAVSVKPEMDNILGDATVRDSIRSYLKVQWQENAKKIGDAMAGAGVDLDWLASLPAMKKTEEKPQTIIINAGNDAVINTGDGTVVKDAVLTGSTVSTGCGGKTTVRDSVVTKSAIGSPENGGRGNGITIQDSVVTSSTIKTTQNVQVSPTKEPEVIRPPQFKCLLCGTAAKPGTKFCTSCGAKISAVCVGCRSIILPDAKFCPQCGRKAF